ncbi:MAG: glutathione S-transferase N-terminal domain-containing protein [Pseudomonadota bacterium]
MIDLYTWTTPNGRKISIMLEELGLPYEVHPVNIGKDEQFAPDFLKISPNNKIPAIVDRETGVSVFESGAILIYLAEKTGSSLLPTDAPQRAKTIEWLMFQMGGVGPMFGQFYHFASSAREPIPYAVTRYREESKRLLGVMNKRLAEADYLAGEYSIADIATYPWVKALSSRFEEFGLTDNDISSVVAWLERVGARGAVKKGMEVPAV